MQQQSFWFLENFDVSEIFCPKKFGNVLNRLSHKTFQKGEFIYIPEDHADKIYFIFEGRVKISATNDEGKKITKAILSSGEIFGELSLVGEEKRRDFATAMEETTVCIATINELKMMIRNHSGLNLFLMRLLGSRVLAMENRLESLVFKDSRTRIIDFLLDLAKKKGQRVGYERVVRKFLPHQEIANLTATSRQTVTTVLNDLKTKNILTFDRRRLLIRDMERLEAEK